MNSARLLPGLLGIILTASLLAEEPREGTLASNIQLPLILNGKSVGSITLKAGAKVSIIHVRPNGVLIARGTNAPFTVAREALTAESLVIPTPSATPLLSSDLSTPKPIALTEQISATPPHQISEQSSGISPEAVNQTFGLPLFSKNNLWEENDSVVAFRLGLPMETRTSYESGYGYEPDGRKKVLGAENFSIYLRGFHEKTAKISLLFANKGDILHYGTPEEIKKLRAIIEKTGVLPESYSAQMVQKYQAAIRNDQQMISDKLTKLFGSGRPVRNFKTSWMSEEGMRWNWQGTSFFLFAPRNEYLTLRIEPEAAVNDLESERKAFASAKDAIASRVQQRPNGDVIIADIPMVDQGRKGYCVPATIERVLRYYNIDADMNMLAMGGHTEAGGGTSFENIFPVIDDLARNAGGHLTQQQFTGKISDIKLAIDRGKPVIWGLFSSRKFNEMMAESNAKRKDVTDWDAWNKELTQIRKTPIALPQEGSHCCMIIGYNQTTHEIALSDSWGPEFQERWMTEEEATAVKQGGMATIGW